jgi:hypothetical protein
MMERYFDAHLYFANWGTRRLMLRVPRAALDIKIAEQYFYEDTAASLTVTGEHLIIDLYADREPDDYWEETPDLGSMVGARSELIAGDCRLLYLAWLFAVSHDEVDDEATEPPVPAGLAELSAPLEAIVEFLEIDEDLIDIAVEASPHLGEDEPREIGEWIASLPVPAKDKLLGRVASGEGVQVQALLLRQLRERTQVASGGGCSRPDRHGSLEVFTKRIDDLRRQHQHKPSLMERFDAAGLA